MAHMEGTKAHALNVQMQSDTQWISRSTQNHTVRQYTGSEVHFFSMVKKLYAIELGCYTLYTG